MQRSCFSPAVLMALVLSLGFIGCDTGTGNTSGNVSPFNWKDAFRFYQDGEDTTGAKMIINPPAAGEESDSPVFDSGNCLSIVYGNGIIVVGGIFSGRIACSSDKGETWAITDCGLDNGIRSMAFAAGNFVAQGSKDDESSSSGDLSISSNGRDWNIAQAPEYWFIPRVLSAGDSFFSRRSSGGLGLNYSLNGGETWAPCDSDADVYWPTKLSNIAYGSGTHVLAGNNKTTQDGSGFMLYSPNGGANWSNANFYWTKNENGELSRTTGNDGKSPGGRILRYIDDLIYGDGTFVAGGKDFAGYWSTDEDGNDVYIQNSYQCPDGIDANIIISSDGINWTRKGCGMNPDVLGFGNGVFVGLNSRGDNMAVYSSDKGETWKTANGNFGSTMFYKVVYGSGYFAALGFTGSPGSYSSSIYYSDDSGKSWKAAGDRFDDLLTDIIYADGSFIAVGENGNIYISKTR